MKKANTIWLKNEERSINNKICRNQKNGQAFSVRVLLLLAAIVSMVIYARSYAFKKSPRLIFVYVQIVRNVELFSLG